MNKNIFKAYDVRGKYPSELNENVVFEIGSKLSKKFNKKILVGHDTRNSSIPLTNSLIKSLKKNNHKLNIIRGGVMSTPMFYFLVNKLKTNGGIMITASHNPKEYNGLKVVREGAKPFFGKEIKKIVLEK
ncbi:hypothetical protein GW950_01895 [Candidatus Wolfebacteria bacterium]|nr:hypothetical protein [Candidatus Wolfebacteria bacterium]